MLTRRQFLKTGTAGVATLAALQVGWVLAADPEAFLDPNHDYQFLTPQDRAIIAAQVPLILAGALPTEQEDAKIAIVEILREWDNKASFLPLGVQNDLRKLLDTLSGNFLMRWIAGVPGDWEDPQAVDGFLNDWRYSYDAFLVDNDLRVGYLILVHLTTASWYGNPSSWAFTGYAGPPQLY